MRRLAHMFSCLASVAWLAACSGSLPGVAPNEPPPRRGLLSPPPRPAPQPSTAPAPSAPAAYPQTAVAPGAVYPSSAPSAPAPAASASPDARERQFEIMNEAVAALRQEVSRSYAQVDELTREGDRLRALVASLRRDLAKSRDENKALKSHIRALERRLSEVRTSAPEVAAPAEQATTQRRAPAPPPAAQPASPPQPPAEPGGAPEVPEGAEGAPQ